jgi:hypothetical protein
VKFSLKMLWIRRVYLNIRLSFTYICSCERLVPDRQGDRGIILFVKNYINVSKISILNENFNESVWCEIVVSQNEKLLVGLIYRNPSSSQQNNDMLLSTNNRAIELGYSNYMYLPFFRL